MQEARWTGGEDFRLFAQDLSADILDPGRLWFYIGSKSGLVVLSIAVFSSRPIRGVCRLGAVCLRD